MTPEKKLAIYLRKKELTELCSEKNVIEMELREVLEKIEVLRIEIKELEE